MKYHKPFERNYLEIAKNFLIDLPAFLIFISYLYLATYYYFFDVDIFSYLSINTIVLYAIENIGIVAVLTIAGYLLLQLFDYLIEIVIKSFIWIVEKFELDDNKPLFIALIILYFSLFVLINYGFSIYLFEKLFPDDVMFILSSLAYTLFIVSFFVLNPLMGKSLMKAELFNLKTLMVSVIIITSLATITKGFLDAVKFKNGSKYQYVMGSDLKGNYPDKKLKLIGKADDHYFLKYANKETVIIKQFDDFKRLHLQTFRDTTKQK